MGSHDYRNVKRNRTSKEETGSASSSEGVDHVDDQMKGYSSKKHQSPATKPTAHEEEVQPAGAEMKTAKEKRKRVVRDRLPENLIGIMLVHSYSVHEIPDERLARYSEEDRAFYAKINARTEKWIADEQALIDQYLINGYVESVSEVTDDEDESDGMEEVVDIIN